MASSTKACQRGKTTCGSRGVMNLLKLSLNSHSSQCLKRSNIGQQYGAPGWPVTNVSCCVVGVLVFIIQASKCDCSKSGQGNINMCMLRKGLEMWTHAYHAHVELSLWDVHLLRSKRYRLDGDSVTVCQQFYSSIGCFCLFWYANKAWTGVGWKLKGGWFQWCAFMGGDMLTDFGATELWKLTWFENNKL